MATFPTGDEFRRMSEAEKLGVLRMIDAGNVPVSMSQALDLYEAITDETDSIYDETIDDLAEWGKQISKLPGCLGQLLNLVHGAVTDIVRQEESDSDQAPSAAEYKRWMPVVLMARHVAEELASKVDAIKDDPDAARERLTQGVDRIISSSLRDPLEDLLGNEKGAGDERDAS